MPRSKHRRKGKNRARVNFKNMSPPPPIDYEYERRQDALLMAQLRKMYGGNDWGDWTDEQIEAALDQMEPAA